MGKRRSEVNSQELPLAQLSSVELEVLMLIARANTRVDRLNTNKKA